MTEAKARVLSIEISTKCEANCYICPRRMTDRQDKEMSYEDILDISNQGCEMGTEKISPHLWGEPTMHSRYIDVIYALKDLREKYSHLVLGEYTNGSGWKDDSVCEAQLDVFDEIVVSVDGATHETMAKMRPGLDPVEIENNIKKFCNMKKQRGQEKPVVYLRMTDIPQTQNQIDTYSKKWLEYADEVFFPPLQNFDESLVESVSLRTNMPCDRLFYQVVVTVNKNVVLCCSDYKELLILGNLEEGTLEEFWYGEEIEKVRELHLKHRSGEIALCKACTYRMYLEEG